MIENKQAYHNFEIKDRDKYECGIILTGSEVKPLRNGDANLNQAYCYLSDKCELFIKNMHIGVHNTSKHFSHEPLRERKLLLKKKELNEIKEKLQVKGFTILPLSVFISNGFIKVKIGIGKGKRDFDKRESIKTKDIKRDTDRQLVKYK